MHALSPEETFVLPSASREERDPTPADGKTAYILHTITFKIMSNWQLLKILADKQQSDYQCYYHELFWVTQDVCFQLIIYHK